MAAAVGIPPSRLVRARQDCCEHPTVSSMELAVRRECCSQDLADSPAPSRTHRIAPAPTTRSGLDRDRLPAARAEAPILRQPLRPDRVDRRQRPLERREFLSGVHVAVTRLLTTLPGRLAAFGPFAVLPWIEECNLAGGSKLSPTAHRLGPQAESPLLPTARAANAGRRSSELLRDCHPTRFAPRQGLVSLIPLLSRHPTRWTRVRFRRVCHRVSSYRNLPPVRLR